MLDIYYSDQYVASDYAFETTRKAALIAESLCEDPIEGAVLQAPVPIEYNDALLVHEKRYLDALVTGTPLSLAESNEFSWNENLWPMVCSSNGGMVAAACRAFNTGRISGTLSSGMHHAYAGTGGGYCTINGLALAAVKAQTYGARNVLILDSDAHNGGGTYDILRDNPFVTHMDISVCDYDDYSPVEPHCLKIVRTAGQYLETLAKLLSETDNAAQPFDLVIYNAGMDPYEKCREDGLPGITIDVLRQREDMVFSFFARRNIPVAFSLAGGYISDEDGIKRAARAPKQKQELVDLHRLTITAAAAWHELYT